MKIIVDKESLISVFTVALYAIVGGDYADVKDVVIELLEKVSVTPLPIGYGKLIDANTLRKRVSSWGLDDYTPEDFIDEIDNAEPIVEADTTRDCKTCWHSKDGKCSYTEECHECMFENKYVKADKKGEQE